MREKWSICANNGVSRKFIIISELLKSTQVTCYCQVKSSQVECDQVDRGRLGHFSLNALKSGHVSVPQRLAGLNPKAPWLSFRYRGSVTGSLIVANSLLAQTYAGNTEYIKKTSKCVMIDTCWIKSAVLSFQEGKSIRSAIFTDNDGINWSILQYI